MWTFVHCCFGKSHRLPSHASTTTNNTPFKLLFLDLWAPAPVKSSTRHSYYLSIVDVHSRFTWIYLLKQKSDTLTILKNFKELIQVQFNSNIKSVQSDWG